jgi:hypothetical protein
MKGQLANLPARQPANPPPPPSGVERRVSSSADTCLGSANATIASPRLDPATSRMLEQYLACIAARGWGRVVFEMHAGRERFDFSCRPPNDILATPISPRARAQGSRLTADQWDAKRQTSARKREREKRRTTWTKERKKRAMAASGPALADTGKTAAAAAAAPTAAAAAASATAAIAASSQAAVAATYCEAAKASLPTAEGAMRRTRAAARKDVVATATATGSSAGGGYKPVPACPAR